MSQKKPGSPITIEAAQAALLGLLSCYFACVPIVSASGHPDPWALAPYLGISVVTGVVAAILALPPRPPSSLVMPLLALSLCFFSFVNVGIKKEAVERERENKTLNERY